MRRLQRVRAKTLPLRRALLRLEQLRRGPLLLRHLTVLRLRRKGRRRRAIFRC
jgi:hypothetical protein